MVAASRAASSFGVVSTPGGASNFSLLRSVNLVSAENALKAGIDFHRAGRLIEAGECYETALKGMPRNSDALHLLGLVEAANGRVERGIGFIQQALKIQPRFPAALFNLGNLLLKENLLEPAVAAYKRALALQPKFAEARCNLGNALVSLGKLDEAVSAFRGAIAIKRDYAEAHRNLGLAQQKLGALDAAVGAFRQAVALKSDYVEALYDLGVVLQIQEKFTESIEALRQALESNPSDARIWLNLAGSLQGAGRLEEAEVAYRRTISFQPQCTDAHLQLGNILKNSERLDEAVAAYREVLGIDSSATAVRNSLGSVLLAQGNIAEAINAWYQAALLTPLPPRSTPEEIVSQRSFRTHQLSVQTARLQITLEFSIIVLTSAVATTTCAPTFFEFATGETPEESLRELDARILAKTADGSLPPPQSSPDSPKTAIRYFAPDDPKIYYLFSQRLDRSHYHRTALECMRVTYGLGLEVAQFLFHHGLLSAHLGFLEEADVIHQQALVTCLKQSMVPELHAPSDIPEYLWRKLPIPSLKDLLEEASSLGQNAASQPPTEPFGEEANRLRQQGGLRNETVADSLTPLLQIEAHNILAENLINYFSDFDRAREVYLRRNRLQTELLHSLQLGPQDTLFLGEDWVRNIGHIACLGYLVKMQILGLAPWHRIVLFAREHRIANGAYLDQWRPYITVVTDAATVARFEPLTTVCGFRFSTLFPFVGREPLYTTEISSAVEEQWEAAGKAPLLSISPELEEAGRQRLETRGIGRTDWFVCLHIRETGYHAAGDQTHRNGSTSTYLRAIKTITDQGGWVIRLGDPSMSHLPEMDRVLDYAHSTLKSPQMDVFLCATCRFAIGTNSGMSHVPYTFGTPVVMTNWIITGGLPPYPRNGLFLPKMIYSTAQQRILSFRELLTADWRSRAYSNKILEDHGASVVDNTLEEIDAIVREMLDRLRDAHRPTPKENNLQEKFTVLLHHEPPQGTAKVGTHFLKRHATLLDL
jgi:putative glycosyltransferase (TIGR04372 family)